MAKVARPAAEKQAATSLELITNLARLYWDDVADRITALVRPLVEEFLEARRTELLGAGAWERTDVRTCHRGGRPPSRSLRRTALRSTTLRPGGRMGRTGACWPSDRCGLCSL